MPLPPLPLPLPPKCSYITISYPTHLFGSGGYSQPFPLPLPKPCAALCFFFPSHFFSFLRVSAQFIAFSAALNSALTSFYPYFPLYRLFSDMNGLKLPTFLPDLGLCLILQPSQRSYEVKNEARFMDCFVFFDELFPASLSQWPIF